MVPSTERRPAQRLLARLASALLLVACIDTSLEDAAPVLPCAAPMETAAAAEALVWIRVDLDDAGYRYCSAVAISPRLVLTTYSCVAYPGDLDPEASNASGQTRFPVDRQTYYDPAQYQAFCDAAGGWTPREDGSFRARLSEPVALSKIGVGRPGELDRPTLAVDALIAAGSSSRCSESLALLLLSNELKLVELPLRLDDVAEVGEPILMSGVTWGPGRLVRRDQPGLIGSVTRERGDASIPPQSLLLETSSCSLSRGGPVLSESSGALVALVAWGQSASCDDAGSGTTTALRLAPYRELLLEAASSYGQTLFAERRADAQGAACADIPGGEPAPDP
jgi:hypothetical protein